MAAFDLPPGTQPPDAPQPSASGDWFPHVIDQVRNDDGTVSVTFALPGLRVHTLRVPLSSWLAGEHFRFSALPDPLPDVLRLPSADGSADDEGE